MLTNKFKATVLAGAGVIIAGVLVTNQVVQQKQITTLQDEVVNQSRTERMSLTTPTASPTATLTPTVVPSYRYRAVTPTNGGVR